MCCCWYAYQAEQEDETHDIFLCWALMVMGYSEHVTRYDISMSCKKKTAPNLPPGLLDTGQPWSLTWHCPKVRNLIVTWRRSQPTFTQIPILWTPQNLIKFVYSIIFTTEELCFIHDLFDFGIIDRLSFCPKLSGVICYPRDGGVLTITI